MTVEVDVDPFADVIAFQVPPKLQSNARNICNAASIVCVCAQREQETVNTRSTPPESKGDTKPLLAEKKNKRRKSTVSKQSAQPPVIQLTSSSARHPMIFLFFLDADVTHYAMI